ncbi:MAG TPA: c-type cytochrome biogenesis protein CcmI [Rudaea sp.]|nr:c-type cytochrome biogenesis protein CcmI [Rudaea sp.]
MTFFILIAALMLAAALGFVLWPLLRNTSTHPSPASEASRLLQLLDESRANGILSDDEYHAKRVQLGERLLGSVDARPPRSRSAFVAALALALLVPLGAIVLYGLVGTPAALNPDVAAQTAQAPADHGQNIEQAITSLAAKLEQNPDDAQGWALLGRAYENTQRFDKARDALKRAHDLAKDDPDITVAYAEALTLASESRRIEGEPLELVQGALKVAPDNERGLWLLGISQYQNKQFDDAIATWKHLQSVLPKGSDIVTSVQKEIERAQADRDGKPAPDGSGQTASGNDSTPDATAAKAPTDTSGPQLHISVDLDAKLKSKVADTDVLFIYAKAASGPPMPLAIQRMSAGRLPASVVLTDGMGMLPSMKLSQFPQVVIGARISKSGNAMPQSGDLQVLSKPIAVNTTTPIKLTIDQVVP